MVFAPLVLIWILNLLLPEKIHYTFYTWGASMLLICFLRIITTDQEDKLKDQIKYQRFTN